MRPRLLIALLVTVGFLAFGASNAKAADALSVGVHVGSSGRPVVDLAYFHSNLSPYGRWASSSIYGDVYVPRVARGWRPYTRGHWVYTDYGWTWVSTEAFGWATYHYGRWVLDPDFGWIWVPGTTWAPAYVDWRYGDDCVGWAPLPPTVGLGVGTGYASYDFGADLTPVDYVFVPARSFLAVDVTAFVLPRERVVSIWPRTRTFTRYQWRRDGFFNAGLPLTTVEGFTRQRVPRFQVAAMTRPDLQPRITGNRLAVFRPEVQAPRNARTAEWIATQSQRADSPFRRAVRRGAVADNLAMHQARAQAVNPRSNARVTAQRSRQTVAVRGAERRVVERQRVAKETRARTARVIEQRNVARQQAARRQQVHARSQAAAAARNRHAVERSVAHQRDVGRQRTVVRQRDVVRQRTVTRQRPPEHPMRTTRPQRVQSRQVIRTQRTVTTRQRPMPPPRQRAAAQGRPPQLQQRPGRVRQAGPGARHHGNGPGG